jgi:hypothetical protein
MAASSWLLALVKDALGPVPGSNTLTKALERLLDSRRAKARELLRDALSKGEISLSQAINEEEAAAILYRFDRAAIEGAATLNLRLMATVIANQAFVGNLIADEFLYFAEMLGSLRREEVILIATMHRIRTNAPSRMSSDAKTEALVAALVPVLFPDPETLRANAMACMRTGLVMDRNTMDDAGNYTTSPLMDRLEKLAPFEEALRAEGIDIDRL